MSLLDGLTAYWPLWEASGTRYDAHVNGLDLTDNNTVAQQAGKLRKAGSYVAANTEYLSRADEAAIQSGNVDWTITCWFNTNLLDGANHFLWYKSLGSGGGGIEVYIRSSTNKIRGLYRTSDGSGQNCDSSTALSTGTWTFCAVRRNAGVDIRVMINTSETIKAATATQGSDVGFGLRIGVNDVPAGGWDGGICEMAYWNGRRLSDSEISRLYNNGRGLEYPFYTNEPIRGIMRGNMVGVR